MAFPKRLLGQGEELVLDLRPHWISLVPPIFVALVILVAMGFALAYLPDSWPGWTGVVVVLAAVVLIVAYPVRRFVAWVTSHFVVTTDRVIHREGWFAKRSMEIPVENINDVRFVQSVFERIIGAGDLRLESAGEYGQNLFTDIRDPEHVQKVIYEVTEGNQQRMMAPRDRFSLSEELERLDRLRDDGVITEAEFQAQKSRLLGQA